MATTPTIIYRSLGSNYDPLRGQGKLNFLANLEAVAQILQTRLNLFNGEWWENHNIYLPLWQKILGKGVGASPNSVALLISQVIFGVPYVTGITAVNCTYNNVNRAMSYSATVFTQFGTANISNPNIGIPTPPSQGLP